MAYQLFLPPSTLPLIIRFEKNFRDDFQVCKPSLENERSQLAILITWARRIRSRITMLWAESPRWYLCVMLKRWRNPSMLSFPEAPKNTSISSFRQKNLSIYLHQHRKVDNHNYHLVWRCEKGIFVCKVMNLLKSARYFLTQSVDDTAFPDST